MDGEGLHLEMNGCTVQNNGDCDVIVEHQAELDMRGTTSTGNMIAGYTAQYRARMTVIISTSVGDRKGYGVSYEGQLTMEDLVVDGVPSSGTLP